MCLRYKTNHHLLHHGLETNRRHVELDNPGAVKICQDLNFRQTILRTSLVNQLYVCRTFTSFYSPANIYLTGHRSRNHLYASKRFDTGKHLLLVCLVPLTSTACFFKLIKKKKAECSPSSFAPSVLRNLKNHCCRSRFSVVWAQVVLDGKFKIQVA